MGSLSQFMSTTHRECDEMFAAAESAVNKANFAEAKQLWAGFKAKTEVHFDLEENTLFPKFETKTGNTGGPAQVMRNEHALMRALFLEVKDALEKKDAQSALSELESCMIFMQQHNMKEEQILYPMLDKFLVESDWAPLVREAG